MANRKIKAELEIDGKDNTSAAFRSVATRMGQIERQMSSFNKTAANFEKQVARIERSSSAAQKAVNTAKKVTAQAGQKANTIIGAGLAAGGSYLTGHAVVGAIKDFSELERQMTRIGITAGSSGEETKAAFEGVQKLTKDLKFDSVQPGIEALDTLTASGKSLEEAMAFLPAMLMTAQATGSATNDIANTGLKAADAFGIKAKNMQRAFDVMVTGAKEGQFEMKDMAQYVPDLANSFASLGYKGEDGLKKLVAILQTMREDTGSASSAASYAQNVFGKIYSNETSNAFGKMGVDLDAELEKAKKNGEDAVSAFVRISNEATGGDLSKLPKLFTDQEFRLGMQSLMTSADSVKRFETAMNSVKLDGTVLRDFQRVAEDTKSSVDGLSNSMGRLYASAGEALAQGGGKEGADWASDQLDYASAVNRGLEKNGTHGFWARTGFGIKSSQLEKDEMAIKGGYNDPKFVEDVAKRRAEEDAKAAQAAEKRYGRYAPNAPPVTVADPQSANKQPPVAPITKDQISTGASHAEREANSPGTAKAIIDWLNGNSSGNKAPASRWDRPRGAPAAPISIDANAMVPDNVAAKAMAEGGKEAGKAIEDSATAVKGAGADAGADIKNAAQSIREAGAAAAQAIQGAAQQLQSAQVVANGRAAQASPGTQAGRPLANVDPGRTMPPETFGPR
ncbi:TP901 family phage tail tape measure protein [Agrobacterium vitis]|nr:TP901 family phage tail tape measure protein [Agrobacterium vitis]MBE1437080.1 TP901 family phage tail tape measure protein [Agrobacterium vitis]